MSKYTFANLLNGETSGKMSLETFMDYLKKEHSEENLEFWLEAVKYREEAGKFFKCQDLWIKKSDENNRTSYQMTPLSSFSPNLPETTEISSDLKAKFGETLESILKNYIVPGSDKEIGVPASVSKKLIEEVRTKKNYNPDILKQSMDVAYENMKNNSFLSYTKAMK
ncbi:hypothetical protein LY90DRAFT_671304 [Neocallimastix californiae]|jgi:hypothetical protein|uniref:RGS domain-containing protein n=1 Tax=Neocallimastix californiae TaxID=1754190 RepID=A0A1Y2CIA5_9FUNG|nr:hypothetical protein LY90DRAFT_671304 [Neocallimastix californiae]|eukprot:ORY46666.1 hypothetical protein LY90DRAFT_671304 [Neocallimastix californiae]